MRNAGGEASGGGEFLGVAEGFFGAEAASGFGLGGLGALLQQGDVAEAIVFTGEGGVVSRWA